MFAKVWPLQSHEGVTAAAAIVDAANGRKQRLVLLFYFCLSHVTPFLYLYSVDIAVTEDVLVKLQQMIVRSK